MTFPLARPDALGPPRHAQPVGSALGHISIGRRAALCVFCCGWALSPPAPTTTMAATAIMDLIGRKLRRNLGSRHSLENLRNVHGLSLFPLCPLREGVGYAPYRVRSSDNT